MTLTSIIAKIILYAKRAIVSDNSSSAALSVTQSGSGPAITTTGYIGVGISSPAQSIDVSGNIQATGSLILDNPGALPNSSEVSFRSTNTETGRINVYTADEQDSYMAFRTLGSGTIVERMRIDSTGNIRVGTIGTPQAVLDVASTTSGIIFPRMTTTQRNAITPNVDGMVVYNTTDDKLQVRANAAWVNLH